MQRIPKRRRLENKTDYRLRMELLKSQLPRIVIRKTNKYLYAQIVESHEAKDLVKKAVSSRDLLKEGWDKKLTGSLKSIPACYLTGLLLAREAGKGKFIIDMGMARNMSGGRIYALVKGLVDGGMDIKVGDVIPSKERLEGDHLKPEVKAMIKQVKEKLKK